MPETMNARETVDLTPEQLVDLQVPSDVRISPSGKYCVYACAPISKKGEHAVSSLWLAELGLEHSARQITSGLFNDVGPQWRPNASGDEAIAIISDRAKAGESSAIYLMSLAGGEAYPVTQADAKKGIVGFKWSPDGHFIAFLSADEKTLEQETREKETGEAKVYGENWEYDRLRLLNVDTREITTLVTSNDHVTDFAWKADSKEIAFCSQLTTAADSSYYHGIQFSRTHLDNKSVISISETRFPGRAADLVWIEDELFFVAGASPNRGASSVCVYSMSLATGDWSRREHGVTDCVASIRSADWGALQGLAIHVLDGLSDKIRLLSSEKSRMTEQDVFTHDNHELQTWDVWHPNSDAPMKKVVGYSTVAKPREIYSYEGGKICQLSNHGQAIAELNIGEGQPIHCKSSDGTPCDGVFMRPTKSDDAKPLSTVVLVRGGPYSRISISFNTMYFYWTPMLVAAGYGVLCPNYRGGAGHGEDYAAYARGGLGTVDYDDVIALIKHGVGKDLIDADNVFIGGYSQGGFMSYFAVTRSDFRFKGAICGAGVTDHDMLAMTSDAPYYTEEELGGFPPWISTPERTGSRHGSAIWHMKNVKTPILILHGEADERVPISQAVAFHRGCLHYGVPCEFVSYPREPHRMQEGKHLIDMLKRIRRFVDLHLQ